MTYQQHQTLNEITFKDNGGTHLLFVEIRKTIRRAFDYSYGNHQRQIVKNDSIEHIDIEMVFDLETGEDVTHQYNENEKLKETILAKI